MMRQTAPDPELLAGLLKRLKYDYRGERKVPGKPDEPPR